MTKQILTIVLLISIFRTSSFCQQESKSYQDRIFLKNGSELRGKVLYYTPKDSVVFEMEVGKTMTFAPDLIKKVKMAGQALQPVHIFSLKQNTIYTKSQFSVLYQKNNSGISISQSIGYQHSHWAAMGIGIGIDNYRTEQGNNLMPVFAEAKVFLLKQNASPFFSFRAGYSFAFAEKNVGQTNAEGNYFFNPTLGYRLGAGRPYVEVFCGAKFQKTSYQTRDAWSKSTFDIQYRRYDMGMALTF